MDLPKHGSIPSGSSMGRSGRSIVERKTAQVLSVSGDVVQLMDMADYATFELPIPAEYKDRVVEGKEIQYITALGKMRIDMR